MLIPSGSSSSNASLCVFSSASSFLRSLPCFSNGIIPQFIDGEDGWQKFNESMHSRYGFSALPEFPLEIVTKQDFKILEEFHNQLDEGCQWMAKGWIDLLKPLVV